MRLDAPWPEHGVLVDPELDRTLREEDVVVTPLLSAAEVHDLTGAYREFTSDENVGMVIDYVREDRSLMQAVNELLAPVWDRHLPEVFVEHRPVVASFLVKHPGTGTEMPLHDELSFVDERVHRTYNVWIPLVDVGPGIPNGGLEVVPRSQRLPAGLAGINTPVLARPYFHQIRSLCVPVTAAAGSAVIYDTRLIHASGPNLSGEPRPAIGCATAPGSAQLIHVIATGRRHRRVYAVDRSVFVRVKPFDFLDEVPRACSLIDEFDDDEPTLRPEDVGAVLSGPDRFEPLVLVPPDVADGREAESFDRVEPDVTPGFRQPAHDLRVRAAQLTEPGSVWAGRPVVHWHGGVGVVDLDSGSGDMDEALGQALPDPEKSSFDRSVVVLDQGARMVVGRLDPAGGPVTLDVVESPAVGSGFRADELVGDFDPGRRFVLPPGQVTLWNDGPGPLAFIGHRSRRDSSARGGRLTVAIRRLLRRGGQAEGPA